MNRLIDKFCIFLLCLVNCSLSENSDFTVICLLIVLESSLLTDVFSSSLAAWSLIFLCSAVCGVLPTFFLLSPLMLYDALKESKLWLAFPCLGGFMQLDKLIVNQFLLLLCCLTTSFVLFNKTYKLEKVRRNLSSTRDRAEERNINLEKKNKALIQNQDREIYLATLEERNRIAREIHDNVGHMLTSSLIQMGALQIINKDENLNCQINEIIETLDSAMTSMRNSVHNLHADSIDLKAAVSDCIKPLENKFQLSLKWDIIGFVPKEVKFTIVGILRETISNICKHSTGDKVEITIAEHPGFYQLIVEDNGTCDENLLRSNEMTGLGLLNMKQRAAQMRGIVKFFPSKTGFKVFLSIPKECNL